MRKLLSALALLGAILFATPEAATAQVRRVPNTGCPNAAYPSTAGSPRIGQGFGVICPPCRTAAGAPAMLIGLPARGITLNPPLTCVRGCVLALRPIAAVGGAWRILIPNNPRLVGLCLRFQCACVERSPVGRPCVVVSGAIDVCLMR